MRARERKLTAVPWPVYVFVAVALAMQLTWASHRTPPEVSITSLPQPPGAGLLRVAGGGEQSTLARVLILWLQAFDYQPGVSIALGDLDYARLESWLDRVVALDANFQYPFLAAARVYGEVADAERQRRMIAFIERHFEQRPLTRWQWMAHAVYLAKHRLEDLQLALALSRRLARLPAEASIPSWVRQMHIFVLEDMGELESAKVLLGGLLESGEIEDPHERWFLSNRLHQLEHGDTQSLDAAGGVIE